MPLLAPVLLAAGFISLFDGRTLNGWELMKPAQAEGSWIVEDGALTVKGRPRELRTSAVYGSFDFTFEWKIAPGGNSGVLYRVEPQYHPPQSGPEYQVLDDDNTAEGKIPTHRAGAVYDLYVPAAGAAKPAGEWNTGRILVQGTRAEHWLNGVKVAYYDTASDDWKSRVAKSKFARFRQFSAAPKGHIVLQDHGSPVWFRNLNIRPLD